MEQLVQFLQSHAPFLVEYRYLLLGLLILIDGANATLLGGLLVSVGAMAFAPVFAILIAGDFVNGFIWYAIGYYGGSRVLDRIVGKKSRARRMLENARFYFSRHSAAIILLAKMTYSLTNAVIAMVGSLKYDIRKFGRYNAIGSFGWICILFPVGYFFGVSLRSLAYFREATFLIALVAFLGLASLLVRLASDWAIDKVTGMADWFRRLNEHLRASFSEVPPGGDERR